MIRQRELKEQREKEKEQRERERDKEMQPILQEIKKERRQFRYKLMKEVGVL